jgi:hypothetical protein
MADFFARLQQLAASGALPFDQHLAVRALLRQRAAGWAAQPEAPGAAPVVALPQKVAGDGEGEDWRAVLDRKAAEGGAGGAGAGVQDSARGRGSGADTLLELQAEPEAAAAATDSAAAAQQLQQQKEQAVQELVAAALAGAAWDVALLAQQAQQSPLDLSASTDAEQLVPALLDHATAAASSSSSPGGGTALHSLPPAIEACAALLAELAREAPAVGTTATFHLVAAFKQRSSAGPAGRQQLGQQMLLAGSLAQRGALPEQQLQAMLEPLARQWGGWALQSNRAECLGPTSIMSPCQSLLLCSSGCAMPSLLPPPPGR